MKHIIFKKGDRVTFKEGDGQIMTVRQVSGDTAECFWMANDNKVELQVFNCSKLVHYIEGGGEIFHYVR